MLGFVRTQFCPLNPVQPTVSPAFSLVYLIILSRYRTDMDRASPADRLCIAACAPESAAGLPDSGISAKPCLGCLGKHWQNVNKLIS